MLIKCPECGHQVSDKAPLCPNCGIEISGNVHTCPECGTTHKGAEGECPNCKTDADDDSQSVSGSVAQKDEDVKIIAIPLEPEEEDEDEHSYSPGYNNQDNSSNGSTNRKSSNTSTLIISAIIAAIICGVGLYFYKDAVDRMEKGNPDPVAVVDTTETDTAKAVETVEPQPILEDTTDIPVTEEEEEVAQEKTPTTEETQEAAEEKTESEAKPAKVTDAEKGKATGAVKRFLQAINSNSREALATTIEPPLTSFNGKAKANKTTVTQYMVDLYQADVKNLNWHIDEVRSVEKTENAGHTAYNVVIGATKETVREGGTSKHKFRIKATVNTAGKITAADITRE